MWDIFPWIIVMVLIACLFWLSVLHARYRHVLEVTTSAKVNQTEDKYSEILTENRSIAAENEELKLKVRIAMMYAEDDQAVTLLLKKHRETIKASNTCTICNSCKERQQAMGLAARQQEYGGLYGFPF